MSKKVPETNSISSADSAARICTAHCNFLISCSCMWQYKMQFSLSLSGMARRVLPSWKLLVLEDRERKQTSWKAAFVSGNRCRYDVHLFTGWFIQINHEISEDFQVMVLGCCLQTWNSVRKQGATDLVLPGTGMGVLAEADTAGVEG